MKKIYLTIAMLAIFGLYSCDQITGEYLETNEFPTDTSTVYQKFLLEDYTGYTCGNCPAAHEVAEQLYKTFKDRVVVLGIHAGSFAEPQKAPEAYQYDFRTAEGNIYDVFFGNSKAGNPNGMINRMKINNTYIVRHTKWASTINELLEQEPAMSLKLNTSYDEASRKITAKVDMRYLKASGDKDFVVVLITEDNVIKYQKDYRLGANSDIPQYTHNHVLRAGITHAWGEKISESAITTNQQFSKEFTYTIPSDKDWNPDNLSIVAYVYSQDKAYEILQVDSKKLK